MAHFNKATFSVFKQAKKSHNNQRINVRFLLLKTVAVLLLDKAFFNF